MFGVLAFSKAEGEVKPAEKLTDGCGDIILLEGDRSMVDAFVLKEQSIAMNGRHEAQRENSNCDLVLTVSPAGLAI